MAPYEQQLKNKQLKTPHSRTPSGNLLTGRVKGIKHFLQEKHQRSVLNEENTEYSQQSDHDEGREQEVSNREVESLTETSEAESCQQFPVLIGHDYHDQLSDRKRKLHQSPELLYENELPEGAIAGSESPKLQRENKKGKRYKMEESGKEVTFAEFLEQHGITEDTSVIDVKVVLEMFQRLSLSKTEKMESHISKTANEKIKLATDTMRADIDKDVSQSVKIYEDRIDKLEEGLRDSNRKAKLIEDTLYYQQNLMQDMERRLDIIELQNARRAAVLTGLWVDVKKHIRIQQLHDFFHTELEVYTRIEDAYLLGSAEPAAIVMTFQTMHDKNIVFEAKSKFAQIKKDTGMEYYLNHYLPSHENEKKKRERHIIAEAKQVGNTTEFVKGKIHIESRPYVKKVVPPTPSSLLEYTAKELDGIMKLPTMKGTEVHVKGNRCLAYAIDTDKYETIRQAYQKIRLMHARARHVICAFNLKGPDKEIHHLRDSCDDGENGAGSLLLKALVESRITNRAYFVVRYCSQEKLGENRLSLYIDAAKSLQDLKPYNELLKEDQHFEFELLRKHNKKPTNQNTSVKQSYQDNNNHEQQKMTETGRGARGRANKN